MEDVIGVVVELADTAGRTQTVSVMTWGRLWGALNEGPILAAVEASLCKEGSSMHVIESRVCGSLAELATAPYFFEGLLSFAAKLSKEASDHDLVEAERRAALLRGRDIYIVGRSRHEPT